MAWLSVCCDFQRDEVEEFEPFGDLATAVMKSSVCPPRANDLTGALCNRKNVLIVVGADRVGMVV